MPASIFMRICMIVSLVVKSTNCLEWVALKRQTHLQNKNKNRIKFKLVLKIKETK
jgi:hypothetical protein